VNVADFGAGAARDRATSTTSRARVASKKKKRFEFLPRLPSIRRDRDRVHEHRLVDVDRLRVDRARSRWLGVIRRVVNDRIRRARRERDIERSPVISAAWNDAHDVRGDIGRFFSSFVPIAIASSSSSFFGFDPSVFESSPSILDR